MGVTPRGRRPLPRTGDRVTDEIARTQAAELDDLGRSRADRWTVRDVRASTGQAGPGELVRVFGAATIHVSPPGAAAIGRCALVKKAAAGGATVTVRGVDGATIDGAATATTSTAWGVVRLVAVTATAWETA